MIQKAYLNDIDYVIKYYQENKFEFIFPEEGPFSRHAYHKHMQIIEATASYKQVCMMAANRVGKSELAAYMVTVWATGKYPSWWNGKRFKGPVNILIASTTGKLTRDGIQLILFGPPGQHGTGMMPKNDIYNKPNPKSGVSNAIDTAMIKHVKGGLSTIQFQSYDQGREAFQATARHVILNDEESDLSVYVEECLRTMTTDGIVLSTYSPIKGSTNLTLYLQNQAKDDKAKIIYATWDDAPHLTQEQKDQMWALLPPHERDARAKGIPTIGAGAIYDVWEESFVISPIQIAKHWKQGYGFDVGWNNTAVCWAAWDEDADIIYIYAEYKDGRKEPPIHAAAIRAKGNWITGAIDPASRGRSQKDGEQLIQQYRAQGLNLVLADNTVTAGIFDVYERLVTGRLKVFSTCTKLLEEYRLYRRDDNGKIVKENDHLLDALRYVIHTKKNVFKLEVTQYKSFIMPPSRVGWMGQ